MNYTEATEWLFGTQQFGIKLGLENTDFQKPFAVACVQLVILLQ